MPEACRVSQNDPETRLNPSLHHVSRLPLAAAFPAAVVLSTICSASVAADKSQPVMAAAAAKTGTKYKAEADMQGVLDALAGLGGKPIETLDAAQARQQPTPTDAVMVVLKRKARTLHPRRWSPASQASTRPSPDRQVRFPCASTRRRGRGRSLSSSIFMAADG